jgi:hypothetical protein
MNRSERRKYEKKFPKGSRGCGWDKMIVDDELMAHVKSIQPIMRSRGCELP